MDPLRKAYATLDAPFGTPRRDLRRQFKKLVRRWHPDRFVGDPQGQAEAARRMREINAAYEVVCSSETSPDTSPPREAPPVVSTEPRDRVTRPLSRSAIDGIVQSVGTGSPIDVLLEFIGWSWPLFFALLINPPRYQWLRDELAGRPHTSVFVWQLALVGLALFLRWRQRRKRLQHP